MENKYTVYSNIDTVADIAEKNLVTSLDKQLGYVLIFEHPISHAYIMLAGDANISSICYSEQPYLPGTTNPKYAKFYPTLDELRADVYLLRYHHRRFLEIRMLAKAAVRIQQAKTDDLDIPTVQNYYLE